MNSQFDILIIGGGMVGASLALALADAPLKIGVVEAILPSTKQHADYDARSVVLSYGSRRILEGLKLWDRFIKNATAIETVHISDAGHFGATRLTAEKQAAPALGYVVEAQYLNAVLNDALAQQTRIKHFCPASVHSLERKENNWQVTINIADSVTTLTTKLLIAADGGQSTIRRLVGISATEWDYQQTAIIANVTLSKPHQHIAYERFTANGPIAFLPLDRHRAAMIWTINTAKIQEILALDSQQFLEKLQNNFGYRLGRFLQIGKRYTHPLHMLRANEQVREGLVLIGNAAHSLHPIAGQGFNLSLRDVAVLSQVLKNAIHDKQAIDDLSILQSYAKERDFDQERMLYFTDGVARVFSHDFLPLTLLRDAGLLALDLVSPVKRIFTRYAMGIGGRLSKLARGIS